MEPLYKNWRTTFERIDKFLSDIYFKDVSLKNKLYSKKFPVDIWHLNKVTQPPKSCSQNGLTKDSTALPFDEVASTCTDDWKPVSTGFEFGKTWSVHWFRVDIGSTSPLEFGDAISTEPEIHLIWDSGTEALVFTRTGTILHGLNSTHKRKAVNVTRLLTNEQPTYLYVQVSCSDLFGAGEGGMIEPPNENKTFSLAECSIGQFDRFAFNILQDLTVLMGIAKELKETNRGHQALFVANQMVNLASSHSQQDYQKAHSLAQDFFSQAPGSSSPIVHAMGHCHIDSAWLWRYTETRRKCARSWSTTLDLLKKYPDMTFVCSQAQQLSWLKTDHPDLFQELVHFSTKGQFIPVGGTWVEMDANLPGCEAMIRQFLYGQRFFKKEFGNYCKEYWLPDTFGYCAQLPQIMQHCGVKRFVTQKISWSLVNKFPHHTFYWCGIDGSRVLAHFPPGDSYNMNADVSEVVKTVTNFSDKGRSNHSMFLYGYGDGGQGPTEGMVMRLQRMSNCDGLPKIQFSSPDAYFSAVEREDSHRLFTWTGDLYLELHNGTYTTHRQIKYLNMSCEWQLRGVELLQALLSLSGVSISDPSADVIEEMWKICLLNQFHDVLPGSSIEDVCDDAFHLLTDVVTKCINIRTKMIAQAPKSSEKFHFGSRVFLNPTSWPLQLLVQSDKEDSGIVTVPPLGLTNRLPTSLVDNKLSSVVVEDCSKTGCVVLENQFLRARIDSHGRVTSLVIKGEEPRETIAEGCFGGQLCLYDDVPLFWDAWDIMDYHWETRRPLHEASGFQLSSPKVVSDSTPLSAQVSCTFINSITGTQIVQSVRLEAHLPYLIFNTKINVWAENHKLLKVEFPISLSDGGASVRPTYEISGGHLVRPSGSNTSWDWARVEECSQRWMAVTEWGFGAALLKEAIHGGVVRGGSVMHLSLLRSSKSPDATADRKRAPHNLTYGLLPFLGPLQTSGVVKWSHQLAWTAVHKSEETGSVDFPLETGFALVSSEGVEIIAVKMACDHPNRVIVRFNETNGGSTVAKVQFPFTFKRLVWVNGLEEQLNPQPSVVRDVRPQEGFVSFLLTAFQITSLALDF